MAERKGQVFVDERAIIGQLRWVWEASEQEAGAHFTCKLVDGNLERICRLFSNLQRFAWRWSFFFFAAFNSSLVDSTYECKTEQNATLTGQDRQGDLQLKVC